MTRALMMAAGGLLLVGAAAHADDCRTSGAYRWYRTRCGRVVYRYQPATHESSQLAAAGSAKAKRKDIVDTAVAAGSFKTLVTAVKAADLVETLKGKGPFTVFAPTDAAFSRLPEGTIATLLKPENQKKLQSVLTYHVVPGKVLAKDVVILKSAKTVNGKSVKISVKDGKVFVDGGQVVKTDIKCSNGVIHVINAVMLPK